MTGLTSTIPQTKGSEMLHFESEFTPSKQVAE